MWVKPGDGWVKLNVDAAVFRDNSIGCGAVIREDQGRFLGARSRKIEGAWRPREAEAIALKEALSWIVELKYEKCEIETDSKVLVQACSRNPEGSFFGTIVGDCVQLLKHVNQVLLRFVFRSANSVAHELAKATYSMSDKGEWSEADIIDELIVDEILPEIDPKTLNVPKYAVGLDSRVKEITTLLSSGTEGVIRFGICGMGGVGKTTLAKALYNQLLRGGSFKASCFLANVREVTGTFKGVEYLQQKLINDVVKSKKKIEVDNVEEGIELIKARICSTKILVVVDDLGHHKQFENLVGPFAPGSIVIITTRSEDLLDKIDVESIYRCRVKELDDDMSLKLFTQHALGNAEPSSSLMVLTREILCHADGLPLALEVFGSYLYNQPEEGWKSFIKRLKRNPDSTIQQRLIISLDALESDDPMLKKMFLDIACFLIGSEKKKAVKLLGTYYSDTDYNIGILEKRCLLSIDDRNVMRMHDLLQDMGKEVSRNNSPNEPGKHSRLWAVEDIYDVLKKHKGKDVIEGIIPRSYGDPNPLRGMSLSTKTFKRMDNLRFLLLRDVEITGSFERKLENLRWLCWNGCPLTSFPSEFYPQKLVFLALPNSKLSTMQGLNKVFNNLKDLDMSRSLELTTTPDFTKLPCLETLKLQECRNLEEVDISIGILVKLVYLNLSKCVKLKSLPDTLCNLRALEVLDLDGCMSLEELPLELGEIESLKKLYMNGNENLRYLPDSICSLRSLETLQIHQCKKLEIFPEVYSHLERAGVYLVYQIASDNIFDRLSSL